MSFVSVLRTQIASAATASRDANAAPSITFVSAFNRAQFGDVVDLTQTAAGAGNGGHAREAQEALARRVGEAKETGREAKESQSAWTIFGAFLGPLIGTAIGRAIGQAAGEEDEKRLHAAGVRHSRRKPD